MKHFRFRVWNPANILTDEAYDAYLRVHPLGIFNNGDGTFRIESAVLEINRDLTLSELNDTLVSIYAALSNISTEDGEEAKEENNADKA